MIVKQKHVRREIVFDVYEKKHTDIVELCPEISLVDWHILMRLWCSQKQECKDR